MDKLLIRVLGGPAGAEVARPAVAVFGAQSGTIGRGEGSTLMLSDPERSVSRLHARVDWRGGAHYIANLGINPVLCNGTVLATGAESVLAAGDELRIGRFILGVEVDASAPSASTAPSAPAPSAPLYLRTQPLPPPAAAADDLFTPDFVIDADDDAAAGTALASNDGGERESMFDDMTGLPLPRRSEPVVQRAPLSQQEVWLADLLRGIGCAAPEWPQPLTPQQVVQVGALMRSAMHEAMRESLQHAPAEAQRLWFDAFERAFLRACKAGLTDIDHHVP